MLKPSAFTLLLASCAACVASAQSVAHAAQEQTLAKAALPALMRQKIEKVIFGKDTPTDDREVAEEHATVVRVPLSPKGRLGLRVWAGDPYLCGKSNCPFWIFSATDDSLLFDGDGYELALERTLHRGLYDIRTRHQLGAESIQVEVYHFDGKQYRKVESQIFVK